MARGAAGPRGAALKQHVLILGAGFGGLELATQLSESLRDEVRVTLLDQNDSFSFGFSKLDVMLGRRAAEDLRLYYRDVLLEGVEFRQERVTSIDPDQRQVATDAGSYEADVVVLALGADYDFAATPGFQERGYEYYSIAGAERLHDALPSFDSGTILIGILGHLFKCPPAPFEGAFLLHDHFQQRGNRDAVEIRVIGPMARPVPVTKELSQAFLDALDERGIEYVPNQQVTSIEAGQARLASGGGVPYDHFIGIPIHRVPEVVERSGLAVDGWVPVDPGNLATRFPGVYALGDVVGLPMAKAGVFAETAASVVAKDIAARIRGGDPPPPYEGAGSCFIEFGGGLVAKVEANFLGGPAPRAELVGPSLEFAAEKTEFGAIRRARWFGATDQQPPGAL